MLAFPNRKAVRYLRHVRDADGDLLFYFLDPSDPNALLRQSSPVVGLHRLLSAVLDWQGHGSLGKYVLTTRNSEYEVQMPREEAERLARELGVTGPAGVGPLATSG